MQKQPSIGVLKIYNKFIGEHPSRSLISIKVQSNFIEITLRHWCSPVILLRIFRAPLPKNTSGGLLLRGVFGTLLYIYIIDLGKYIVQSYNLV